MEAHRQAQLPIPTMLIVDEDDLFCQRLRGLAAGAGFDAHTARDGYLALAMLQSCATSIVFLDIDVSGMGSLELCRRIRARRWPENISIVFLSCRENESDIAAAFEAGADDYVSKQTSDLQFRARLRTVKRILALEQSSKQDFERARHAATTDPLTGAYNRRYFRRHLGRDLKRIQRFGGNVSLMLLEIDHFKILLAEYGNAVGDVVVKEFIRIVSTCFRRDTDWCVRLGRRVFAIVLEGTKAAQACAYAQVVRQSIADAVVGTTAGNIRITVSIGVSGLEDMPSGKAVTVNALVRQAGTNLYASVLSGCNRVTLSDSPPLHL